MERAPRARAPEQIRARDGQGRKLCVLCEAWLPEGQFYRSAKTVDGLLSGCKACNRRRVTAWAKSNPAKVHLTGLKVKYGMSRRQLEALLVQQGGSCAICGSDNTENGFGRLVVDHDHACCSGKRACGKCIRGLLCSTCNLAIGYMRDSPDLLIHAAHYLEEWSASKP